MFRPRPEIQREVNPLPRQRGELSRRRFLKTTGTIAAGAALDHYVTRSHWPSSQTRVYTLDDNRTGPRVDHGWLVSPGYGSIHGAHMAHQVQGNKGIPDDTPIGAFVYGNALVTPDIINSLAAEYADQQRLSTMSLYCHSMGGLIGLTAARAVGRPLRRIILNASPRDINDADLSAAAKVAAGISRATGYRGSLTSKYIGALFRRFDQHGVDDPLDFFNNFVVAGEQSWKGAAPECMGSQLVMLDETDDNQSEEIDYHDYRHLIIPGVTQAVYAMSRNNPEDDSVVKTRQAADKWEADLFGPLGVTLQRLYLPLPNASLEQHANTAYAMHYTPDFVRSGIVSDDYPAP